MPKKVAASPKSAKKTAVKKEKKVKAKKDPNAPKKALSGYMFFMMDFRKSAAAKDKKVTEIGKLGGEAWKALANKKKYEDLAAKDKVRYEKEMAKYTK